jgi:serine-type D-Ala-D-Ala carboxypeptidase (penicillin-binding protein 5/6)
LTKMMTALVAMDRGDLSTPILATERSMTEPVVIGLDPGERMRLEDALYGLLLPSGNDAALAIAETLGGGSIDAFVAAMNEKAAALNLHNTHFANPHGLDAANHYSSARDLGVIARAFLTVPTLARIVSTERYTVGTPLLYLFLSSNPLLGFYPGADGVKTGFTDDAGRTFVGSATRNGHRVIAVVLNSPDIRAESSRLLDIGFGVAPSAWSVPRLGFAAVRALPEESGVFAGRLAGWEPTYARAMAVLRGNTMQVAVSLGAETSWRWTQ